MKPTPKKALDVPMLVRPPVLDLTTELESVESFAPPLTIEEVIGQGPSELGLSTVSNFLACPERARLNAARVRRKTRELPEDITEDMDELGFGSLFHAVVAVRAVWGMEAALDYIGEREGQLQISSADRIKAQTMLRMLNSVFPLENEPFEILGVESTVRSDIRSLDGKTPLIRSVRYDTVIRLKSDPASVYSLELKTASRSGEGVTQQYTPQRAVQSAVWNANPALVEKYGRHAGTIFNVVTKAATPSVNRYGPFYTSRWQEQLALNYLRLPEAIEMPVLPSGAYPTFLHSCWGKYRPCEYIGLCWENEQNGYEVRST